jgi:hypothetical protein
MAEEIFRQELIIQSKRSNAERRGLASRSTRRSEGDGQPNEGRKFSGTVRSGHG